MGTAWINLPGTFLKRWIRTSPECHFRTSLGRQTGTSSGRRTGMTPGQLNRIFSVRPGDVGGGRSREVLGTNVCRLGNNYQLAKMLLVRDHCQITFITPNRFCLLIKKFPIFLFLIDNTQLDWVLTKIKWKIHKLAVLHWLFSLYDFSQIFRTSFNIIWEKDFHHEIYFSNRFTQHPLLIYLAAKIC